MSVPAPGGAPVLSDLVLPAVAGGTAGLRAVLGVPAGQGPWPGVVVVHEAFGVDDVMRRQVGRLASAGYLALMPDLFSAGGARRCLLATFRALRRGEGRAFADVEAARRALRERDDCTGRVGVLGFCMGGGFALAAAPRGFDAASANYGMLPADPERALEGACPVVGSYGGRDRMLPRTPQRLEAVLRELGVPHDVRAYSTAGHSFLNDAPNGPRWMRPLLRIAGAGPEPAAAADAWRRIEEFFGEHLGGPAGTDGRGA